MTTVHSRTSYLVTSPFFTSAFGRSVGDGKVEATVSYSINQTRQYTNPQQLPPRRRPSVHGSLAANAVSTSCFVVLEASNTRTAPSQGSANAPPFNSFDDAFHSCTRSPRDACSHPALARTVSIEYQRWGGRVELTCACLKWPGRKGVRFSNMLGT